MGFPDGWFQIGYSEDVGPGEVLPLRYFGRDLVLFRTERGLAQVVDAYCSHLGAHLGYGGQVDGECIRCPFHGWGYDTKGNCTDIPYSKRIPRGAKVASWPTEERSGVLFVWHHASGQAPWWEPPTMPEHDDPAWIGYHRYRWVVRVHPQDITENTFDPAHLPVVHGNRSGIPDVEYVYEPHRAGATLVIHTAALDGAEMRHELWHYGLGLLQNRATGPTASKSFFTANTPIDDEFTEVRYSVMTPRSLPQDPDGSVSRANADGTAKAFEEDIPIWEHKIYRDSPLLSDGDGPIGRYRRWAATFYSLPANRSGPGTACLAGS
jgi:phenylpropionate dioxygenase-like ring-hydroxylating dioxygenase large terminal subunit